MSLIGPRIDCNLPKERKHSRMPYAYDSIDMDRRSFYFYYLIESNLWPAFVQFYARSKCRLFSIHEIDVCFVTSLFYANIL